MTLVAAAVCPHPPLIVPEIAGGAAAELEDLRTACAAAVDRLARCGAEMLFVLGSAAGSTEYSYPFRGSFAPWGVPLEVTLGQPAGRERLPLSLLVGAWLLRGHRRGGAGAVRMATVDEHARPAECAAAGRRVRSSRPWALLVMGDGSACRGPRSPGYDDPRAQPYDDAVARALADADTAALAGLDPDLSARLGVAGRAPWQVLAAAAGAAGGGWRGELAYHDAPYGVGYFVASWERA